MIRTGIVASLLLLASSQAMAEIAFDDATDASGVGRVGETYGASWGDLDGDGYPDLFVSMHRMPVSLFLNKGDKTFLDVAKQTFAFINQPNADTHGGTWFDYNNDGTQDLLVAKGFGNPLLMLENKRGAMANRAEELGIAYTQWEGRYGVWMDYNGDKLPDLVFMTGATNPPLFRQLATGGFVQENASTGFNCRPGQYAQFLDVTGDGRLNFICPDGPAMIYPSRIWDILPERWRMLTNGGSEIMPQIAAVPDTVVADFDNDGQNDIFVLGGTQLRPSGALQEGNTVEASLINGTKGFNFVSAGKISITLDWNKVVDSGVGQQIPKIYIGAAGYHPTSLTFELDPSDPNVAGMPDDPTDITPVMRIGYDPDSHRWTVVTRAQTSDQELVFSNAYFRITSTDTISDLETTGLWPTDGPGLPALLMNRTREGRGFVDEAAERGFPDPLQCVSAAAGDFDNDGWNDLYLACRTAVSNIENILYRNKGDGTFERVANAGGAAGPVGLAITDGAGTADTVAVADYDVDGFLDLFVTNGLNMRPLRQGGQDKLYHNRGNGNHWVELDLVGTLTHREAIGTIVQATASGTTQTGVKNGSHHRWSHDHTRMHFGLAQATKVDLRITWPSGVVDEYKNLDANRVYRATETKGIETVTPGDALPYPCGLPPEFETLSGTDLNAAVGKGLFIGEVCWDNRGKSPHGWQLRAARGSDASLTISGRLKSSAPFSSIRKRNIQGGDELLCNGSPCVFPSGSDTITSDTQQVTEIEYQFTFTGGIRGFDFTPAGGADTCFTARPPAGTDVLMGPLKKSISDQFDLETVGPCSAALTPPPGEGPPDDSNGSGTGNDGGTGGNDGGTGGNDGGTGGNDGGTGGNDGGTGGNDGGTGGNDGGTGGNDGGTGSDSSSSQGSSGGGTLDIEWLASLLGFTAWRRISRARGASQRLS